MFFLFCTEDLVVDFVGRRLREGSVDVANDLLEFALQAAAFKLQISFEELNAVAPGEERRKMLDDISIAIIIL